MELGYIVIGQLLENIFVSLQKKIKERTLVKIVTSTPW